MCVKRIAIQKLQKIYQIYSSVLFEIRKVSVKRKATHIKEKKKEKNTIIFKTTKSVNPYSTSVMYKWLTLRKNFATHVLKQNVKQCLCS